MLRCGSYSWTLVYPARRSKSTVSWRPLLHVTFSVILTYSHQTVSSPLQSCYTQALISCYADHPYILAFSLIMLHTDAFNKSNKRKMTKPDYIKNTRLPGVAPEVLDVSVPPPSKRDRRLICFQCFYDNIVFAPFIFIEDPLDVNGQRGLVPEAVSRRMSTIGAPSPGGLNSGSGSALLGKNNRIDPYYLITRVSITSVYTTVIIMTNTSARTESPRRPPDRRTFADTPRKPVLLSGHRRSVG